MGMPEYEQRIDVQQKALNQAYQGMADSKSSNKEWSKPVLVAETKQEVKPDYVDQAYVFFRSIMPRWMFILSVPIGAIAIAVSIMVFKRWIDKVVDGLWRKK